MSHTSEQINAPVTNDDINAVLGTTYEEVCDMCTSPRIKMWAKYKPIKHSSIPPLTDQQIIAANYGITYIPTWNSKLINRMANYWFGDDLSSPNYPECGHTANFWRYDKPVGGSNSAYRISDFSNAGKTSGYYHAAEEPIQGSRYDNYTIDSNGNLTIEYKHGQVHQRTLSLGDLSYPSMPSINLSNYYFGVMLEKKGTTTPRYAVTRADTYNPAYTTVNIAGLSSSFNGIYKIFPFLSSQPISFTSNLGSLSGNFIALYETQEISIGVSLTKIDIRPATFIAYRELKVSHSNLYWSLVLENNTAIDIECRVDLTVFNSSSVAIATDSIVGISIQSGSSYVVNTYTNIGINPLANAYSARVIVTPTLPSTNIATDSAVSNVENSGR